MDKKEVIISKINEIISEMKLLNYLSDKIPNNIDHSKNYSNISFEGWIQFVYIPELQNSLKNNFIDNIPLYRIGISALRNYDYMSIIPEAHKLMKLCFDLEKVLFNWIVELPKNKKNKNIKWFIDEKKKIDEIDNITHRNNT